MFNYKTLTCKQQIEPQYILQIKESIFINARPEVIFSFLMELDNRKKYIPALQDVIMLDPLPIGLGSRYIEIANIAGRNLRTTYQITDFEENKYAVAETLKSIFPIKATSTLTELENGTELSFDLDFKLSGVFKLASGIVSGIVKKQTVEILNKVKNNVENL